MKKIFLLKAIALLFVFSSCQKEMIENESMQEIVNETDAVLKSDRIQNFRAHLSGREEVPSNRSKATGQALFQLSSDGSELKYKLIVANIFNVTMTHIHIAPAGENGPVVVWLYPESPPAMLIPGRFNGILAEGVITSSDLVGMLAGESLSTLLDLMKEGNAYVNVHTSQFPPGEIRGQIFGNGKK